jgi:SAM-dependent methyltransferase
VENSRSNDPNAPDAIVASRRDSFGRNPAGYAVGRPPYPERVFTLMEEIGALRTGSRVLEIGPGTGQATSEILRRGATVDAIELSTQMAADLQARIPHDRLRVRVGDAHTVPLPAQSYDTVVAATTLHWLDTDRLLPRLAETLIPGGWLVAWWNVFGDPEASTGFRDHVSRIFAERLPSEWRPQDETPRSMRTDERIEELTRGGWFGSVQHEVIRWTARMDATQVGALFSTFPAIAGLDDAARIAVLDALASAVDAEGGVIDDPFVTAVYAARSRT